MDAYWRPVSNAWNYMVSSKARLEHEDRGGTAIYYVDATAEVFRHDRNTGQWFRLNEYSPSNKPGLTRIEQ